MTTELETTPRERAEARTPPSVVVTIVLVSAAASALICWLVYFHAPTDVAGTELRSLPLVNAVLNGLSTVALLCGWWFIVHRKVRSHRASMFSRELHAPWRDKVQPVERVVAILLEAARLAHSAFCRRAADHFDHLFPVAYGAVSGA